MYVKLLSIIGVCALLTGCANEQTQEESKQERVKVVKIFDVKANNSIAKIKKYPALVYSFQDTSMAFEVSGKITKFNYDEGDMVKKGSVIAQLDDTIYKANYNSANANYKQAKLDYERYKRLYESRVIAKRDFEVVKQDLDLKRSDLQIAKKRLADTKLIAEFDGILAKKIVKDFERITEKQEIARFQDNSSYKIKFFASEKDILNVKEKINENSANEMVDFAVRIGGSKEELPATFIDISTTAEEISRTFEVTLKIPSYSNKNILPGMTADVIIRDKNKTQSSIFIPLKAVFTTSEQQSFVWSIDKENKVKRHSVQLGALVNDSIEITKGLENVSHIAISGVRFLEEGDRVKEYEKIGN